MGAKRKDAKRRSGGKSVDPATRKEGRWKKAWRKTISSSKKFTVAKLVGEWIPFCNYITKFVFSLTEHLIGGRGFLWIQ